MCGGGELAKQEEGGRGKHLGKLRQRSNHTETVPVASYYRIQFEKRFPLLSSLAEL